MDYVGLKNKNCQLDDVGLKNNHWCKSVRAKSQV